MRGDIGRLGNRLARSDRTLWLGRPVIDAYLCDVEERRGWRPSGRHDGKSMPAVDLNVRWYSIVPDRFRLNGCHVVAGPVVPVHRDRHSPNPITAHTRSSASVTIVSM